MNIKKKLNHNAKGGWSLVLVDHLFTHILISDIETETPSSTEFFMVLMRRMIICYLICGVIF